jgi:uncharacterized FAD-dependent dehydrogenase
MKDINKYLYEGKFVGYLPPYKDKVRSFCQNPSGFVANEVYDNNLTLVNGHSYKDRKSTNTNLAILASHHFSNPFKAKLLMQRPKDVRDIINFRIFTDDSFDIQTNKYRFKYSLNEQK